MFLLCEINVSVVFSCHVAHDHLMNVNYWSFLRQMKCRIIIVNCHKRFEYRDLIAWCDVKKLKYKKDETRHRRIGIFILRCCYPDFFISTVILSPTFIAMSSYSLILIWMRNPSAWSLLINWCYLVTEPKSYAVVLLMLY